MAIHSIEGPKGEPNTWKLKHFANISGSEEFVLQFMVELPRLVEASTIYGADREKLIFAICAIAVEGLMPAFEDLKKIRSSRNQQVPELNRRQFYEDFTIKVWRSYKDLMQRAAKMMEPEIGFIFQNDVNFEKGLAEWANKRPKMAEGVGPYLRRRRTEWQNDLSDFRNYLEHKGEQDPKRFAHHYEIGNAEKLFEAVWRTAADILPMLISPHLPPSTLLVEIPPDQRNPVMKQRFNFFVKGISDVPR
jgi:hypothetical protein